MIESMKINHRFFWAFGSLVVALLCAIDGSAQGNLLITPQRVVFDGSNRTMNLNLANTGSDSATYSISWKQIRMKCDGGFEEIDTPDEGQYFADEYLRFYPRRVTLPPNESQVVKVQMIRNRHLIPGEYRSHLYFRSEPDVTPATVENNPLDTTSVSLTLTPIFGITIPVIIRIGTNDAAITVTDAQLVDNDKQTPRLLVQLNRVGKYSVYGDLIVEHISDDGITTQVGKVTGLAVYTPNALRRFEVQLTSLPQVNYHQGMLRVLYRCKMKGKRVLEAEQRISLY